MKNEFNEKTLTVLRNLNGDSLVYLLLHGDNPHDLFLGELYSRGGEENFLSSLSELIICDKNALSTALANGKKPSEYVVKSYFKDVKTLLDAAEHAAERGGFNLGEVKYNLQFGENCLNYLTEFYRTHGFGMFINNIAFYFDGENLKPIKNPADTKLSDLKNYESEKKALIFNVENFLNGMPFGNTLLYGDRGTGKSSTVQAVLNEFSTKGLRLIQLDKQYLDKLSEVRDLIYGNPLKFIIFIDDLSLSQETPAISAFKAALEGSFSRSLNSMVIATSNRRHIIKENYADRQNDLHPDDAIQDSISLSDRFAVTIMFSSTGKSEYLSIVTQLAEQAGIRADNLCDLAERWALLRGGRSPRTAKQFCDYAYSCVKRNQNIDF